MYAQHEINKINLSCSANSGQVYQTFDGEFYEGNCKGKLEKCMRQEHNECCTPHAISYKFIAGQGLTGQKLVMLSAGYAKLYQPTSVYNIERVLGITNHHSIINHFVCVTTEGTVHKQGWGLVPNAVYYADLNGGITPILPLFPIIAQKIGIAINTDTLELRFSDLIINTINHSSEANITATPGGTQLTARPLLAEYSIIDHVLNPGDSVLMLPAVPNVRQTVFNNSNKVLHLLPRPGDMFDLHLLNAPYIMNPGNGRSFMCYTAVPDETGKFRLY